MNKEKINSLKEQLNRIRSNYTQNSITFMVIPENDEKIKKISMKKSRIFTITVASVTIISILLVSSFYFSFENHSLSSKNKELSINLKISQDKVKTLEEINKSQLAKMEILKKSTIASADYFDKRFNELTKLENKVTSLVEMLNTNDSKKLEVPITSPIDRNIIMAKNNEVISNNLDIVDEAKSIAKEDVIDTILKNQTEDFSKLISEVEERLKFLESRPDHYPTSGRLSSPYGKRKDPITKKVSFHDGIDIANKIGTPVYSAGNGIVISSTYSKSYGKILIIDHGYSYKTVYAHLDKVLVNVGDEVKKGQEVAKMGNTGRSTGPHLHFEIRYNNQKIDPRTILGTKK